MIPSHSISRAVAFAYASATGVACALTVLVLRSPWGGWVVTFAAVSMLSVLALVPLCVAGLLVAMATPKGRRWLATERVRIAERRHAVQLASLQRVPDQHLHLPAGFDRYTEVTDQR